MIEELNQNQTLAVQHIDGPMLVLAGAGSGKTRVVTMRIAHLLSLGIPASAILAVTFTNKAAEEMRHRVQKFSRQNILTCTFHSFAAKLLRNSIQHLGFSRQFTIYDEEDTEKLLKECFADLGFASDKSIMKSARSKISQAKNDLLGPQQISADDELMKKAYTLYQEKLRLSQAVDFDDLLFLTVKLLSEHPAVLEAYRNVWTYLLIDEYQDTNFAQYQIVKLLSAPRNNVFAVGDPDQSIYSWRGARIQNILHFAQDFPGAKIISLEQNYRSRSNILNAANGLIKHNQSRYEKELWSARGEGEPITLYLAEDERQEARFVVQKILEFQHRSDCTFKECAIFYRTNAQSRTFEDALLQRRIPYVIVGGISFYERREIKDLLSFLRIVDSGADVLSFIRTINIPKRGIGEAAVDKIREAALAKPIFEGCVDIVQGKIPIKLSLKQLDGLKNYVELITALKNSLHAKLPLHETIHLLVDRSGYLEYLKEDPETYQDRRENVSELISKAAEWSEEAEQNDLSHFLEELSLRSTLDEVRPDDDFLRLMTLHNSKGLEFSFVALVGMEEELLPHMNAIADLDAIEEERRLAYVGMTRAKEELVLSAAKHRFLWGTSRFMRPSRFLSEIPKQYLDVIDL
jgi:DNA helicase-2/ATP-dependent DNA helicase PcrA